MESLKNMVKTQVNTPLGALKVVGFGLVFLLVAVFVFSLVLSSLKSLSYSTGIAMPFVSGSGTFVNYGSDVYTQEGKPQTWTESDSIQNYDQYYDGYGDASISARNVAGMPDIMPIPPYPGSVGNTAEEFQVRDFFYTYTPSSSDTLCADIYKLKTEAHVIFESSSESDRSCDYRFKVEKNRADEIKALLNGYDPKDVSESIYTIQEQVKDYTDAITTLTSKKGVIEETLSSALLSYDEIQSIATKANDPDSLAIIIDSKIRLIERLTNEKLMVEGEIDRLQRAKARELDRIDYTFFTVSVYEMPLIDGERLAEGWRVALELLINEVSYSLQKATLGLLGWLFFGIVIGVYLLTLLFAAKYGWRFAKKFWLQ